MPKGMVNAKNADRRCPYLDPIPWIYTFFRIDAGGTPVSIGRRVAVAVTPVIYSSGCIEVRKPYLASNRTEEARQATSLWLRPAEQSAGHATYTMSRVFAPGAKPFGFQARRNF